jgi:hypothetical protein
MNAQARGREEVIPAAWRTSVRAALAERGERVRITQRAKHEWEAAFPHAFAYQLYTVLEETLASETVKGRRVENMHPEGEAYEFFFEFEGRKVYGKINLLTPERRIVLVISSHIPNKGDGL